MMGCRKIARKMTDTKDLTVCVIDSGLFLPVAQRLARSVKRVLYFSPSGEAFPTINRRIIGDGYADIERVKRMWAIKNEVDLWVVPDINQSDIQIELESQGRKVWGSRAGDSLEIYREFFHRKLAELGLDVPTFTPVMGMTKLKEFLKDKEDKFLKISEYRGSMETYHWRSWRIDEGYLDMLSVRFGPTKEIVPFLVFDPIKTDLEIGGDTYCVNGQWPDFMLHGLEAKDSGYFSAVTPFKEMPECLVNIMEAFSPYLQRNNYRNEWSMEVRVKGDKAFFTDPTCRGGLPSTASQLEVWGNFPEIVWAGANGELVQPEPLGKFTAEAIVRMKCDKSQWGVLEVPKELQQWLKLSCCCEVDGRVCFPTTDDHGEEIGWLVAIGDTPEETLKNLKEYTELLPDGVTADLTPLEKIFQEIEQEEKAGIHFTEKSLPEPAEVLDS
jgi:hypothetical protein